MDVSGREARKSSQHFRNDLFTHRYVCMYVCSTQIVRIHTYIPIYILIALLKLPEKWIFNFTVICICGERCVSVWISQCNNLAVDGILYVQYVLLVLDLPIRNGNWFDRLDATYPNKAYCEMNFNYAILCFFLFENQAKTRSSYK